MAPLNRIPVQQTARQDEIESEFILPPSTPDDGTPVEDITKREPEVKRRYYPTGTRRPTRQKNHVALSVRLAKDCYEYLQFLVANGNADSLTAAIERCIRDDRAAQSTDQATNTPGERQ